MASGALIPIRRGSAVELVKRREHALRAPHGGVTVSRDCLRSQEEPRRVLMDIGGGHGLVSGTMAEVTMPVSGPDELKGFNVTISRFDPAEGPASGQEFTLPVDSPDEEHAIASTLANAASFSRKVQGGEAAPVAFMAVRVTRR